MAIRILTGQNVSPEVLFLKGYQDKLYEGNGFSHYALTTLGKKYGVTVTWTESADSAFSALQNKNPVIFNVRPEDSYYMVPKLKMVLKKFMFLIQMVVINILMYYFHLKKVMVVLKKQKVLSVLLKKLRNYTYKLKKIDVIIK